MPNVILSGTIITFYTLYQKKVGLVRLAQSVYKIVFLCHFLMNDS